MTNQEIEAPELKRLRAVLGMPHADVTALMVEAAARITRLTSEPNAANIEATDKTSN